MIEKHFVTFFSPGTFFAEQTTKPIDSWNVDQAKEMASSIEERYGATPYGFQFSTRSRTEDELDSSVKAKSQMYYINCKVRTLAEVEAANDPSEEIMLRNMKGNGWDRIVQTVKGWKWTQPLQPDDIVLQPGLPPRPATSARLGRQLTNSTKRAGRWDLNKG